MAVAYRLDAQTFLVMTTDFGLGIDRGFQACRNPDLVVFTREELRGSVTENNNPFAKPTLIAECLSPRDRKGALAELLDDYRRMRAPEVWIIDPRNRVVERHRFGVDQTGAEAVSEGEIAMAGVPAVAVPLQPLWDAFDGEW